jgi:hypothetical protein
MLTLGRAGERARPAQSRLRACGSLQGNSPARLSCPSRSPVVLPSARADANLSLAPLTLLSNSTTDAPQLHPQSLPLHRVLPRALSLGSPGSAPCQATSTFAKWPRCVLFPFVLSQLDIDLYGTCLLQDFIEDDFNLTGLSGLVPFYKEAMEMVLDVEAGERLRPERGGGASRN